MQGSWGRCCFFVARSAFEGILRPIALMGGVSRALGKSLLLLISVAQHPLAPLLLVATGEPHSQTTSLRVVSD